MATPTENLETPGSQPTSTIDPNIFLAELQKRTLGSSGMVSSSAGEIDKTIEAAISGTETAQAKSAARITSQFDREIAFEAEQARQKKTSQLESRRGFATGVAALNALDERTTKSLRDLEQRKQELILQGESEATRQIINLQVQALQFKQQAEQQAFTNILQLGQFTLNQKAEERAASEFTQTISLNRAQLQFQKQQLTSSISIEFGITPNVGESLDSFISRAAATPQAVEERSLKLKKFRAEIKKLEGDQTEFEFGSIIANSVSTGKNKGDVLSDLIEYAVRIGVEVTPLRTQQWEKAIDDAMRDYETTLEKEKAKGTNQFVRLFNTLGINIFNELETSKEAQQRRDIGVFDEIFAE